MEKRSWRACLELAQQFWLRKDYRSWLQLLLVLGLQVVRAEASTALSESTRRVTSTVGRVLGRESAGTAPLLRSLLRHAFLVVALAPLQAAHQAILRNLRMAWSKHLTKSLLRGYVRVSLEKVSREERMMEKDDGPAKSDELEQHVAEDVDKFVDLFLDLFLEVFQASIHLVFFARMLWRVSPNLSKSSLALSILGTGLTLYVGKSLPKLYERERRAAGNYRYALTRVRENAESIVFYNGERNEILAMKALHENKQMETARRKEHRDVVKTVSETFRNVTGLLPFYLLSLSLPDSDRCCDDQDSSLALHSHSHSHGISHGHSHTHNDSHSHKNVHSSALDQLGLVLQAKEAFDEILFHLMILAENLNDFARLQTVSEQLFSIHNKISQTESVPSASKQHITLKVQEQSEEDISDGTPWLAIRDLTVSCRGETLVEGLSLSLVPGARLLVTGESGVGKTTLLRVIQGLYSEGSGFVVRPPKRDIVFIPQEPYMTLGTLREQLLYPLPKEEIDCSRDEQLVDVLELVGLTCILERAADGLNTIAKWSEVLSIGEQQRLAFARIILLKPSRPFVFLDEATSACDIASEMKMYALLSASCSSWVSVGHRPSIEQFHDQRLVLRRGGGWHLEPLI